MTQAGNQLPWQHVHFVGVGGVGMAGLAHILADLGITVTGTDAADSAMLATLAARGLAVHAPHGQTVPAEADLVVYSNAVPVGNPERSDAATKGIPSCLRGEFLARLATHFPVVISIAGSHGKTTTTAMLAHILRVAGQNPGFLVGASIPGWPRAASAGDQRVLVTEVDESDGTQALMRSTYAVVINVEDDHCWSVGGIEALEDCFRTLARRADHLLAWDSPATRRLLADHPSPQFVGEEALPLDLPMPGKHNRIDAALALTIACELGVARADGLAALRTFPGVDRRLSVRYCSHDGRTILVEDYAHHPTELNATISALREAHPEHSLHVIFQPHRFERVLRFGAQFSEELASADRVVVYRPFAAWRQDAELADPAEIAHGIQNTPARYATEPLTELAATAAELAHGQPTVIAVIGAGDIQGVIDPLRRQLGEQEMAGLLASASELPCPASRRASWAELTTLGVGSARPLLLEPRNEAQLQAAIAFAQARELPVIPLGRGSNLVGTDVESPLLALRLSGDFTTWEVSGNQARVGAGVALGHLARKLAEEGRCPDPLLPLAWIPATIGGATRMNAGAEGTDMAALVTQVRGICLADGPPVTRKAAEIQWRYRETDLSDLLVTEVWLDLPASGDATRQQECLAEFARRRNARQPKGRSAGCIFRNPPGDSAGRLLDFCGCKGMRVGGAEISQEHANILTADPGTSEADFLALIRQARECVLRQTGVQLAPEVQTLGQSLL